MKRLLSSPNKIRWAILRTGASPHPCHSRESGNPVLLEFLRTGIRGAPRILRWSLSVALLLGLVSVDDGSADANGLFAVADDINALLKSGDSRPETAERLVSEYLALDSLAAATFRGYLAKSLQEYEDLLPPPRFKDLVEHHRSRLLRAYQHRLSADLVAQIAGLDEVEIKHFEVSKQRGRAVLHALFADRPVALEADLISVAGTWKAAELRVDGQPISDYYRRRYKAILDGRYSPQVLEAQLAEREFVVLEDFAATWDGSQPIDWGPWKKKDRHKPVLYRVEGRPRRYMVARDSSYSVIVGKLVHWNPRQYPIMTWCWRAAALPLGGNEFLDDANDSAAGVYVIFSKNWLGVPKQLKYVWSTTLPEGTVGRRDKIFRPWFFVVESGATNLDQWTFEVVDLEKHHRAKLGGRPAKRTIGLGLLTDANSTRSYAEAYYADLRVWTRQAFDGGRVVNYCGGLPVPNANGAYAEENAR